MHNQLALAQSRYYHSCVGLQAPFNRVVCAGGLQPDGLSIAPSLEVFTVDPSRQAGVTCGNSAWSRTCRGSVAYSVGSKDGEWGTVQANYTAGLRGSHVVKDVLCRATNQNYAGNLTVKCCQGKLVANTRQCLRIVPCAAVPHQGEQYDVSKCQAVSSTWSTEGNCFRAMMPPPALAASYRQYAQFLVGRPMSCVPG